MACSDAYPSAIAMGALRRSASSMAASTLRSSVSPSSTNSIAARALAATSCSTWAIFRFAGRSMSPRSAASSPRIAANKLDLPAPLAPVIPTLLPRKTVKFARSTSGCGPRRRVSSRADSTVLLRRQSNRPQYRGNAQGRVMRRSAGLARQYFEQLAGFHGIAEQASLGIVAAMLAQEFQLLARFHAFRDHLEIETLSHVDDGADDRGVVRVHGDIADERLVDLQGTDRKLLQCRQRGIPRAEIVDGQVQAHGIELVQKADGALRVRHQRGFRDFQLEAGGRDLMLAEHAAATGDEARLLELAQREIDGDSAGFRHGLLPLAIIRAHAVQDPFADIQYQAGLFGQ